LMSSIHRDCDRTIGPRDVVRPFSSGLAFCSLGPIETNDFNGLCVTGDGGEQNRLVVVSDSQGT
jgi:hypothetical protein